MAKFSRDLKAELAEAQIAAQQWEEKYIEAREEIASARRLIESMERAERELRVELGQASRELIAVTNTLDTCRRERGEALDKLARARDCQDDSEPFAIEIDAFLRQGSAVANAPAEDDGCECPGVHECGVTTSTVANLQREVSLLESQKAALSRRVIELEEFANAPAAPKSTPESDDARRHAERDWVLRELAAPTRTDYERAVLEACRDAVIVESHRGTVVHLLSDGSSELVARAVLAWREAAK